MASEAHAVFWAARSLDNGPDLQLLTQEMMCVGTSLGRMGPLVGPLLDRTPPAASSSPSQYLRVVFMTHGN
jgi:hypothetical protein